MTWFQDKPPLIPERHASIPLRDGGRESELALWPSEEEPGWSHGAYLDHTGRRRSFRIQTDRILNALERLRRIETEQKQDPEEWVHVVKQPPVRFAGGFTSTSPVQSVVRRADLEEAIAQGWVPAQ